MSICNYASACSTLILSIFSTSVTVAKKSLTIYNRVDESSDSLTLRSSEIFFVLLRDEQPYSFFKFVKTWVCKILGITICN